MKKIDFIQVLRGLAALAIVLFHAYDSLPHTMRNNVTDALFYSGSVGVDLFFVISGFIMVYATTTCDGTVQYVKGFLVKRFLRIWPLYAVITVLIVFPGFHTLDLVNLFKSLVFYPLNYGAYPYMGESVLKVGWTLNFEAYFYLIFGITLLFGRARWVAFSAILILTLIMIPLAMHRFTLQPMIYAYPSGYLAVLTNPIIWEFAAGAVAGWVYTSKIKIDLDLLKVLIFIVLGLCFYEYFSAVRAIHGILNIGGLFALLILLLGLYDKQKIIKCPKTLIFLGDISYSLYLVQALGIRLAHHGAFMGGRNNFAIAMGTLGAALFFCIALAILSYHFLERGLLRFKVA